jgi:hypothetical protein
MANRIALTKPHDTRQQPGATAGLGPRRDVGLAEQAGGRVDGEGEGE